MRPKRTNSAICLMRKQCNRCGKHLQQGRDDRHCLRGNHRNMVFLDEGLVTDDSGPHDWKKEIVHILSTIPRECLCCVESLVSARWSLD
jgi:hypothetical protein